jgi:hypothetical protein
VQVSWLDLSGNCEWRSDSRDCEVTETEGDATQLAKYSGDCCKIMTREEMQSHERKVKGSCEERCTRVDCGAGTHLATVLPIGLEI